MKDGSNRLDKSIKLNIEEVSQSDIKSEMYKVNSELTDTTGENFF